MTGRWTCARHEPRGRCTGRTLRLFATTKGKYQPFGCWHHNVNCKRESKTEKKNRIRSIWIQKKSISFRSNGQQWWLPYGLCFLLNFINIMGDGGSWKLRSNCELITLNLWFIGRENARMDKILAVVRNNDFFHILIERRHTHASTHTAHAWLKFH